MTQQRSKPLVVGFHIHDKEAAKETVDRFFEMLKKFPEVTNGMSVYAISTTNTFAELEQAEDQLTGITHLEDE